jgi:hypothetical protein
VNGYHLDIGAPELALSSVAALFAFSLTCYGWGRLVFRFVYGPRAPLHAYVMGLGVVTLTAVGGVLNSANQATRFGLSTCAFFGIAITICFGLMSLRKSGWPSDILRLRISIPGILLLCFVLGWIAFLLIELLPSQILNHTDDFQTYMVRPVRMQSLGTVGGVPFELLGMTDFGAQAFLQAIFLLWAPLTSIAEFEVIFCFLLGIILVAEIGLSNDVLLPIIALAIAVFVAINPQIVNLAPVYSTSVVLLTLLSASRIFLSELQQEKTFAKLVRHTVPVGGSLAAMLAFKTTAVFFIGSFFFVFFGLALVLRVPNALRAAIGTFITAGITLLPWLLLNSDKFNVMHWTFPTSGLIESALTFHPSILDGFRRGPSYDGPRIGFACAGVAIGLSLIAGTFMLFHQSTRKEGLLRVATDVAGISTYVGISANIINYDALRYTSPFLIALASTRLLFPLNLQFRKSKLPSLVPYPSKAVFAAIAVAQLMLLVIFSHNLFNRVWRIATQHTVAPWPFDQTQHDLKSAALNDRTRDYIRGIQRKAPAGSTIWAWVDTPFHFDFARNRIWYFSHPFFMAPWRINASTSDDLKQELIARGVDYILWQYERDWRPSLAYLPEPPRYPRVLIDRIINENTTKLLFALRDLTAHSDILYDDGKSVLIQLRGPSR